MYSYYSFLFFFFFFNDTATTEIYTLSLHDALPVSPLAVPDLTQQLSPETLTQQAAVQLFVLRDRKSTRLNSSHMSISYAVFCLKKKNKTSSFSIILTSNIHLILF